MIFSDLASPAEAGFAKAENRCPLFGIMLYPLEHDLFRKPVPTFRDHALIVMRALYLAAALDSATFATAICLLNNTHLLKFGRDNLA